VEDQRIIELYLQNGTKWSNIAKYFEKRTGDMIKNRFYSTLRKKVHGFVRSKKSCNRKIKRIRKIRKNSKNGNKNLFQINNLQIIKNEIIINDKEACNKENNNLPLKPITGEKYNTNLTITEEDLSKLKTDSSIYPKNLTVLPGEKASFLPFSQSKGQNDFSITIPVFPPHSNAEQRTNQSSQPSAQIINPFVRAVNVNEYIVKIKQIESSMNQSLLSYLSFSNQYQMMSTLYNLYLNNTQNNLNHPCDKNI
jgi:hypothetical protein